MNMKKLINKAKLLSSAVLAFSLLTTDVNAQNKDLSTLR